ncbi:cystatin-A-like [Hyla sarda]|uniref:cystatin-A-like n=1 Tax=Hyla sarda TaxID=327740 RepID=UPI0024C3E34A|nr:cystatin-A-like [Hyla sarda]XP_056415954.1 cystatin-A-like [Hyla sarda]
MDVPFKGQAKEPPYLPGGVGPEEAANPDIQSVCDAVKPDFLKRSAVNATKFKAVKYKSQTVAGYNYFIKVWLGGTQYCHLRIYKPLPHTGGKPRLDSYQMGKTEHDAITHF